MTDSQFDTLAFLGPSCSIEKALRILPDCRYLPPVKCGDILQALRLKPRRIAIIDGVFSEVPSVWHKEILFAIEKGVEVWGAASMGALRAAELHMYGMRGFGQIFSHYRDSVLTDDDEVAIVYYQDGCRYISISDAMVNIRATLQLAVEQSIVPVEHAEIIISQIKKVHFAERHLTSLLKRIDDYSSTNILEWLANENYVDLKCDDAIALLSHLRDSSGPRHSPSIVTKRTLSLRRLNLRIMTAPLDFAVEWLPERERKLQALRHRPYFKELQRLAFFLALYDGLLKALKIEPADEPRAGALVSELIVTSNLASMPDVLCQRLCALDCLFSNPAKYLDKPEGSWLSFYFCYLKLQDVYLAFKRGYKLDVTLYAREHPIEHRILYLLSHLWWFYQNYLQQKGFEPQTDRLHKQTIEFRRSRRLWSAAETERWMTENDLDQPGMHHLMTMECNYKYLVEGCFFENLGFLDIDEDRCWLSDAFGMVEDCLPS